MPFKDTATSDYVAICVIGVKGRKRYVLNVVNQRLDAGATEAEIRRQRDVHRPISAVLVEGKANGSAVVQRLKLNVPGVIEINPEGGKDARMSAAAPEWQAGDWVVDRNAGWTEPFVEQITMFPNAQERRHVRRDVAGFGLARAGQRADCHDLERLHGRDPRPVLEQ